MEALLVILTVTSLLGTTITGHEPAEKKLHDFLLSEKYSKLIRPTGNNTVQLTVKLGMRLSQLLDVVRKSKYLKYCWELNVNMFDAEKVGSLTCMEKKNQVN